jgi:recombination protein RecA
VRHASHYPYANLYLFITIKFPNEKIAKDTLECVFADPSGKWKGSGMGDMGAQHVGKQARLMSQALRKLTAIVAKTKTVVIFINQIRMQIGVMFGNPETTPGGKALKFYTSVRIDIRRVAQIKKGDEVMGGRHRVKIVKNKVAAPFRQTEFDMMYGEGISKEGEALALGEKMGLVTKSSGGVYELPSSAKATEGKGEDLKLGRGYDAARTYLHQNKPVLNQLLKDIRKHLNEGGVIARSAGGGEE